jgi:hypothetical protein
MSKQVILPRCLPVYPLKERIKGVIWGVTSGIFTAIGCGWMTDAPWFWQRVEKLISWLPS